MCHRVVNAKDAKLIVVKSSTMTDYKTPASGRVKIVPHVIHEQAVPGKKLVESALDTRRRDI